MLTSYAMTLFEGPNLRESAPLDNATLYSIGQLIAQLRLTMKVVSFVQAPDWVS